MSFSLTAPLAPAAGGHGPEPAAHDHTALGKQVGALGDALANLARQQHADRLLGMIRRPGWTTPQEAALVGAMVGHLADQLAALHRGHDALLGAAGLIGA